MEGVDRAFAILRRYTSRRIRGYFLPIASGEMSTLVMRKSFAASPAASSRPGAITALPPMMLVSLRSAISGAWRTICAVDGDKDREVEHARLLGGDAGQHRPHVDVGRRHRFFGDHFAAQLLEVVGGDLGELRGVGAAVMNGGERLALQLLVEPFGVVEALVGIAE